YTAEVNGFDSLIITKLDVLDQLDEIPVCVAYEVDGNVMTQMPASTRRLAAIKPVYERLPGWKQSTRGITRIADLPSRANEYLKFLEERTEVEIGSVSNGPERSETLIFPGSRLEQLLA
ncbi:MAG: adenylosuccinate synthetase, partial [Acidobacteriaceae bacterium]|nr:adenylosuccinate synthetase [Acidobacteriaceae bacterium]